jgi:hypothetical protein
MTNLFKSQLPPDKPDMNYVGKVSLKRFWRDQQGTFGVLSYAGSMKTSVELPWRNNEKNISCIPTGIWMFERYFSPKHNCEVFVCNDVPGRKEIEIHVDNVPATLEGCIGIGNWFGIIGDVCKGVVESKKAFDDFMLWAKPFNRLEITITDI